MKRWESGGSVEAVGTRRVRAWGSLGLIAALLTVACDPGGERGLLAPDATLPTGGVGSAAAVPAGLGELETEVAAGIRRIEVELLSAQEPLTAREVEIDALEDVADEEEIESRITAVSAGTGAGFVTLELGGLEVGFDAGTRFRGRDGRDQSMGEFVATVTALLAGGESPTVEARRWPGQIAQGPGDASFHATVLRLDREPDRPKIEINVDADNLEIMNAPPPDALLRVLGLAIEIRVGTTQIERDDAADDQDDDDRDDDDRAGVVEFEGAVSAVDVAGGAFTLADGRVVTMGAGTVVEADGDLFSLAEVEAALAAGLDVKAEGDATVTDPGPPAELAATSVKFESDGNDDQDDDDQDDDDQDGVVEFEGAVSAVDVAGGSFTLADGRVVTMGAGTVVEADGDLFSLAEVEAALAAGLDVKAEGDATVTDPGPPAELAATSVKFESDGNDDQDDDDQEDDDQGDDEKAEDVDFDGLVGSVDLGAGTFTLAGGAVVLVDASTEIKTGDGRLTSLAQVDAVLGAGGSVEAKGKGALDASSGVIHAEEVEWEVEDDASEDREERRGEEVKFEAVVSGVDVAAGTVTLRTGTVVQVLATTRIKSGDYASLAAVAAALAAGETVEAKGQGSIADAGPPVVVAAEEIEFEKDD